MVKKLLLMRHAVTESNIQSRWTGHLDIGISTNTKNSRIALPELDLIICSTAKRCIQTLDLIDAPQARVIRDSQFIECGYGKFTGLDKSKDLFARTLFNTPESSDEFIGESRLMGGLRAYNRYKQLVSQKNLIDKNVMILSHKNTLCGFWVLYHLDQYFLNLQNCLDLDSIERHVASHVEEINDKFPTPSPFENNIPYDIVKQTHSL